jgi:lysophospholipase L1-like esterase
MRTMLTVAFAGNVLRLILLILVALAQTAYGQPVKIMPLGDSLTSGYRQYVSYRYDLWFLLADAGFVVDFVGSNTTTEGNPNLGWYPDYQTTFDRNHDGYSGYTTQDLAPIVRSVSARHQPDIVLLWAGVNDIWGHGAQGVTNARFALRDIIRDLRASVPGVIILLALNPPYEHYNSEYVGPLNDTVAGLAAELDRPGRRGMGSGPLVPGAGRYTSRL